MDFTWCIPFNNTAWWQYCSKFSTFLKSIHNCKPLFFCVFGYRFVYFIFVFLSQREGRLFWMITPLAVGRGDAFWRTDMGGRFCRMSSQRWTRSGSLKTPKPAPTASPQYRSFITSIYYSRDYFISRFSFASTCDVVLCDAEGRWV